MTISMTYPQMRRQEAVIDGRLRRLTPSAHALLVHFMLTPWRCHSFADLEDVVWPGFTQRPDDTKGILRGYVSRIGCADIHSRYKVGYIYEPRGIAP